MENFTLELYLSFLTDCSIKSRFVLEMVFISMGTKTITSMIGFFYSKNYKFEEIGSPKNCLIV